MAAGSRLAQRTIGRYMLHGEIASGGMATVYLGRLLGEAGFSRTVAIKQLHPHLAKDPGFSAMFIDEARLSARVRHPNVVQTLDVVTEGGGLLLVLDYVHGESLARLLRATRQKGERPPLGPLMAAAVGALYGLHAAHEATSELGEPLGIVHRDVSPQNILVGLDGVARVLDFGVAKATQKAEATNTGVLKGKIAYMAPEQLKSGPIDRRVDVYAMGVVLWEALTGYRLFDGENELAVAQAIREQTPEPPSEHDKSIPAAVDALVLKALSKGREGRFETALEMARAIEQAVTLPTPREVSQWVSEAVGEVLAKRAAMVQALETSGLAVLPSISTTSSVSAMRVATTPSHARLRAAPEPVPMPANDAASSGAVPIVTAEAPSVAEQLDASGARPIEAAPSTPRDDEQDTLRPPAVASEPEIAAEASAGLLAQQGTSQVSSVSLITPVEGSPKARRPSPRWPLIVVGAVVFVLCGVAVLRVTSPPIATVATSPSATVSAASSADPATAASSAEAAPTQPPAAPEPAPQTTGSPAASVPSTVASAPAAPQQAAPTRPSGTTRPAAKSSCNPPFTIDARGIKRLKPECL